MSKDERAIEAEIKAKGLVAKRITPEMLDSEIVDHQFHVFAGSCLTVCCITLSNGFTVTGESACASPENFDSALGRKIAFTNAREKIWPLLGFRLRDQLASVDEVGRLKGWIDYLSGAPNLDEGMRLFSGVSCFAGNSAPMPPTKQPQIKAGE